MNPVLLLHIPWGTDSLLHAITVEPTILLWPIRIGAVGARSRTLILACWQREGGFVERAKESLSRTPSQFPSFAFVHERLS